MKTNEELQKDVQDAIKYEPLLNAAEIGVIAKDGVVTLTGIVNIYGKKTEAESAAKNIAGVISVIDKIEVKLDSSLNKSDNEIATEVLNDLKWRQVPLDKVKVNVKDGWITLEGKLQWNYQWEIAKNAINYITGVKGLTNNISIELETPVEIEKRAIERALARSSFIVSKDIHVNITGSRVILTGVVNSIPQKDEAERIVWNAPGVWNLDNELLVEYKYSFADLKNQKVPPPLFSYFGSDTKLFGRKRKEQNKSNQ